MKRTSGIMIFLLAVLLIISGCASVKTETVQETTIAADETVDAVSQATPAGEGWHIELIGVRDDELWESKITADPKWLTDVELEKKGELRNYQTIPLTEVIAMVDDSDGSAPYSFQQELWDAGYDITVTAADGYAVTFNTAEVPSDAVYLAVMQDGNPISPMIVGEISGQYWVKEIASIELSLAPVELAENQFELIVEIGEYAEAYSLKELQSHPYYIEDTGEYKNSHGNIFSHVWGGVKLVDLIQDVTILTPEKTVTLQAIDGYEMDFSGEQLLDQEDGTWILAFIEDGEFMPEDPGYIRLVKVGPSNPQITGHLSAKMVKKVLIKNETFTDFTLTIDSADGTEIMDRQTVQSGVTSQRVIVEYFNKKKEETVPYMGLPLYEFIADYDGFSTVTVEASDGFSITLRAEEVMDNSDVILAMYYGDGSDLSEREQPLIIVWDQDAEMIPEGIKAVRNITRLILE